VSRFLARRAGESLVVLLGISLASFFIAHLARGNPVEAALGIRTTPTAARLLRHEWGLDKPLYEQYWTFLRNAATFNFGQSLSQHVSVGVLMRPAILVTFFLTAYAIVISVVVAVPLAVVSALRRNRITDHLIRLLTMVTFGMPAFWLGIILVLIFSLHLGWFPTSGYSDGLVGHLHSLTLPAITIALFLAPMLLRTMRSSVIETRSQEFVEAARARGLSERRVLIRHVLRASLISMITVLGLNFGIIFSGTIIIESIFALPGLGALLVKAVAYRDFPLIQALTLVFATAVLVANFVTDVGYRILDPRVRL
jgi:peptide/nickel transport system permease protein